MSNPSKEIEGVKLESVTFELISKAVSQYRIFLVLQVESGNAGLVCLLHEVRDDYQINELYLY